MKSRLDQYHEATDRLPVTVRSPDGWVTVRRSHTGAVSIHLRPGSTVRLTERQLAAEAQAAMNKAYREYRQRCRELRREIIGADVDKFARSAS